MKKLLLVLTMAVVVAPVASAGGWATVGLSSLPPTGLKASQPWPVDITVLQHGRTPLAGVTPILRVRDVASPEPIRDHLERLIAIGGTMTSTNLTTVIAADIALVTAAWEVVGSHIAPSITGRSAEVLRQADDGTWAYLIDQPA